MASCLSELVNFLKNNKTITHIDLSHNLFNSEQTAVIS